MIKEIENFMGNYQLKKLASFQTHDGLAWSCDIYENKKYIGQAMDQGNGGMVDVHIEDSSAAQRLEEYAKRKGFDFESSGSFLGQCCDYLDSIKKMKRSCKTKTLIVLKDKQELDDQGVDMTYSIINRPFTPELKKQIAQTFPNVLYILNEELTQPESTKKIKPK